MNARKRFLVGPGEKVRLVRIDASDTAGQGSREAALAETQRHVARMDALQSERKLWGQYVEAYQDALEQTSTEHAPWFVIPADHKWFRNLAISQIVADTMDAMGLKVPPTRVDLTEIRNKYHAAEQEPVNPDAGSDPARSGD